MDFQKLKKPTLLLDEEKCRRNIKTMAEKARLSGVNFRPHFKTHQSTEVGKWFSEDGVKAITVSSVTMAKHFAAAGWNDITIAFPINPRETDDIFSIAEGINLNILISDQEQIKFLGKGSECIAGYFIKINTGYNRSGIEWDDEDLILRIIDEMKLKTSIRFKGFLTHSGHTYNARSKGEMENLYNDSMGKCSRLRSLVSEDVILSMGDTPSCSIVDKFDGFEEIRPGNFVFYDLTQFYIGSCNLDSIALTVACPVVEKNRKRNEIIFYGGGVHLSKESIKAPDGKTVFGKAVFYRGNGWSKLSNGDFVRSLSQEHGIISSSDELFKSINVGDMVGIIPVHACMTADLLRQYSTYEGKIITGFSPK